MSTELKLHALGAAGGDLSKAQTIYAWLSGDSSAPVKAETTKAKADKPKAEAPAEKPKAEATAETPKEEAPALDYQKDVVGRIVAHVSKLTTAGMTPIAAKTKVQEAIKAGFGVGNAKEVPAEKWPALLETVEAVTADV